jgi:hypothetical protein
VPPNYCQKLSSRRGLPRRPSRLGQRNLRGVTPVAGPFCNSEQPARRSAAHHVKPACSLGKESLGGRGCVHGAPSENASIFSPRLSLRRNERGALCAVCSANQSIHLPYAHVKHALYATCDAHRWRRTLERPRCPGSAIRPACRRELREFRYTTVCRQSVRKRSGFAIPEARALPRTLCVRDNRRLWTQRGIGVGKWPPPTCARSRRTAVRLSGAEAPAAADFVRRRGGCRRVKVKCGNRRAALAQPCEGGSQLRHNYVRRTLLSATAPRARCLCS